MAYEYIEGTIVSPDVLKKLIDSDSIVVIRHAEKSRSFTFQEANLTPSGREAAKKFGDGIKCDISTMLCTTVHRTEETCECIREGMGTDTKILPRQYLMEYPVNIDALMTVGLVDNEPDAFKKWKEGRLPIEYGK